MIDTKLVLPNVSCFEKLSFLVGPFFVSNSNRLFYNALHCHEMFYETVSCIIKIGPWDLC